MVARHGTLSRFLARSSLAFTIILALMVTFSHPLGFLGAIVVVWLGMIVVSVIKFVSEPEVLMTFDGTESPRRDSYPVHENMSVEASSARIAEAVDRLGRKGSGTSRVLSSPDNSSTPRSRVLGQINSRSSEDPEEARRKEEAEWAEMFRAL